MHISFLEFNTLPDSESPHILTGAQTCSSTYHVRQVTCPELDFPSAYSLWSVSTLSALGKLKYASLYWVVPTSNRWFSYHNTQCISKQNDSLRPQSSGWRGISCGLTYRYIVLIFLIDAYILDTKNPGMSSGRYGAPSDVAGLALFLSSPGASHLTGAHIILDGGSRYGRIGAKL